ncbi:hypothetical protein R1flu_024900 [Riccia fluitans]|uniref:Uncharacterized protein n=1 Tax=Riccia fluitans TaxID=41844 RepID=A0ABD1XW80_9MARC
MKSYFCGKWQKRESVLLGEPVFLPGIAYYLFASAAAELWSLAPNLKPYFEWRIVGYFRSANRSILFACC